MVNVKDILLIAIVAVLSCGCEHKELCFNHSEHASRYGVDIRATWRLAWEIPYKGYTDWQSGWSEAMGREYASLNPEVPEGLRVMAYRDGFAPDLFNISSDGGLVALHPGPQSLLFYNNDFEFVTITNDNSYVQTMATTRSRMRQSYQRSGETTVAPPDMFFGNRMADYDNLEVSPPDIINVELQPLTFTYVIRYEFSQGIRHVALARGALSGMAKGVYLHSGINSDEPVTLLYDCTVKDWGVEAVIKSFGLPGFPNRDYGRTAHNFMLNLEVRLFNGKTLNFDMDISPQIATQPCGGVIFAGPFEISNEVGDSGGSGFDIDVEDWGDETDVNIAL